MLVDLTIENWKSFASENTFSLVASRERHHGETLSGVEGFRTLKLVPVAAVYGGNASGKTCLFEALSFLKRLVVSGYGIGEALPVEPFRLDESKRVSPTKFDISFFVNKKIFRLQLAVRQEGVLFEELSSLRDTSKPKVLYRRAGQKVEFDRNAFSSPQRVAFIADGTAQNKLFLTNAVEQNVTELRGPYHWFKDCLTPVGVSSRMDSLGLFYTRKDFLAYASRRLSELDTGIEEIVGEDVDVNTLPVPPIVLQQLRAQANVSQDAAMVLTSELPGDYAAEMFFVFSEEGAMRAQRLRTRHRDAGGKSVTFSLQMESSGTRRLLDLMPMLFDLFGGNPASDKVYVVDELDRCFHSMLTSRLVELFLDSTNRVSRRQLLFTTHDLLLMDQRLLRRDEMFIAERDEMGRSELIRMNEFEGLRYDKDLLRSYLDGRFGGVPMFAPFAARG